ncbi:hypothetical protein EBE87_23070 [Pseudoroseomonas wenyumeiae]|uniref:Uncharacterized protein n=1 Tax=Teichococcus wenyumeiae TaxID=2478470 RepID=A0A3A9JJF4_9PROT|nr:hypothetical protein [Pseudoroseomonas wenyumeiae]RKK04685.1 hypothetical protein D6Z83_08240 [Pseudoroseomonas wenyumeiae]RMI17312.1 hypothetical protein EBE87_23070 [Pseudoroseomonas wenyumeiae]
MAANPQGKRVAEIFPGNFCAGCPYWSIIPTKPDGKNGYCGLLNVGDWMKGEFPMLWDGVKICHIKCIDPAASREERRFHAQFYAFNQRWSGWRVVAGQDARWRPRWGRRAGWQKRSFWDR